MAPENKIQYDDDDDLTCTRKLTENCECFGFERLDLSSSLEELESDELTRLGFALGGLALPFISRLLFSLDTLLELLLPLLLLDDIRCLRVFFAESSELPDEC